MLHFRSLKLHWTWRALLILLLQRSRGYQKRVCVLTLCRQWDGEVCVVSLTLKTRFEFTRVLVEHYPLYSLPVPLSGLFSLLVVCARCVLVHVCRWHQYVSSSRVILLKSKSFNPPWEFMQCLFIIFTQFLLSLNSFWFHPMVVGWDWPHRLIDLSSWSPVGGIVLGRIRKCGFVGGELWY